MENSRFPSKGTTKNCKNLIEYEDGADFFNATLGTWEDRVESGRGLAYGGEVFLQKQSGRTTGWIGYTLSSSRRKFDHINGGACFLTDMTAVMMPLCCQS